MFICIVSGDYEFFKITLNSGCVCYTIGDIRTGGVVVQDEVKKPSKAIIAIIVVVLLATAAAGGYYLMNSNNQTTGSGSTTTTTETTNTSEPNVADGAYKDGIYTATGEYTSPGGQESIDVKVTLADKKIADVTVTPHPASGTSVQYQTEFANNFKPLVVGKAIDEVKLSRVAGSSLTSGGFNDAINQIKADAEV